MKKQSKAAKQFNNLLNAAISRGLRSYAVEQVAFEINYSGTSKLKRWGVDPELIRDAIALKDGRS